MPRAFDNYVYLDHNATTPPDARVVEAMLPWLRAGHGNPSSIHARGQAARAAIEEARDAVAQLVGCVAAEVIFTASGTEANNAALRSVFGRFEVAGHLVVSAFEHPSIAITAALLEARGVSVTRVPPEADGVVSVERVVEAIQDQTRLVAVMLANNELGTCQPVAEITKEISEAAAKGTRRRVPVLCDAVQAASKVEIDVERLGVDYLTLGAHKFYGPLGAAALVVRNGTELDPYLVGGSQERRRRAGTENLAAIVGFGCAAQLAHQELEARRSRLTALRDRFERGLKEIPGASIHCAESPRLPNTSHLSIRGVSGENLLIRLDLAGFAVSTGAACASGTLEPSPTVLALGCSPEEALSSIRVSFGIGNTDQEVDRFLAQLAFETRAMQSSDSGGGQVAVAR